MDAQTFFASVETAIRAVRDEGAAEASVDFEFEDESREVSSRLTFEMRAEPKYKVNLRTETGED